jgi:predicted O-linked N-acetylglucosamine transferase (SPINDLY family)
MQVSPFTPDIDAIDFYETAISQDETIASNYWHLGVSYLLAAREDDAQAAWFVPFADAAEPDIDNLTGDLIAVLERAANERTDREELEQAWLLRQHIWALAPDCIENTLHSIHLARQIDRLAAESLVEWRVSELLQDSEIGSIEADLLGKVLRVLIDIQTQESLAAIEACLQISADRELLIKQLVSTLLQVSNQNGANLFAVKIAELCNRIQPDNLTTLQILGYLYSDVGQYQQATEIAEQFYQLSSGSMEQLFASYQLQRTHFTAGNWHDAEARVDLHRQLSADVVQSSPQNLDRGQCQATILSSFFLPYIEDNPRINKVLQNQLAAIFQQNIQPITKAAKFDELALPKQTGCLRIGYIGATLRRHSVGWLSRWLMHHHDRQSFQIFLYCLNTNKEDTFNHQWFRDKTDITSYFESSPDEIAAQIQADEIDILIELDSLTYDPTCMVIAKKPAPIQVSWLGWDSTGIPAVDYFLADPYVLPDDACDYYAEKIWRLPQTYLAVDGFEIGTPTRRREHLDIPADAVIYLSGQSGYKRHPDCVRAQMQIIKAVPNSYFLVKGRSDAATIQNFFGDLAAEVGISLDRLRFLPQDRDEYTHRANLAIADIVLDTFPYNGATTTLETLWMGIPLVTQVGQQFAARNSYTFMLNAGIEEGIAWNQEEYIEWGIKLGLDRDLRHKIHGKLRAGRMTAPVWNTKKFTRDLEQAYREMWAIYQAQQQQDLN